MNASTPLRVGVIGLGWAGRQHMDAWCSHPDAELVALSGQESALLAELGDAYGIPAGARFHDWQELIASGALDVVSIATPTALHAPITVAAFDAGLHVLCEKPMAESLAAASAMVAAAERADRALEIVFNHRRRGEVRALKELVDNGSLGSVYYAKTGWQRRHGIPGMGTWFTRRELAGGGALMDLGVHMLDIALHVLGEPAATTVTASTYAEFGPRGLGSSQSPTASAHMGGFDVEDLATAFIRLDGGATLLLEASWAQWVPHDLCYLEVYGTERGARLWWDGGSGHGLQTWTAIDGTPATLFPAIGADGDHRACITEFTAVVAGGDLRQHRGRQALQRAAVLEAAYRSAATGTETAVAAVDDAC